MLYEVNREKRSVGKRYSAATRDCRKVWKKEDELKQLKSELAALDRKIQLELAPPTPIIEGQEQKNDTDTVNVVQNSNISASKGIRI